jgi:hypothetical protein
MQKAGSVEPRNAVGSGIGQRPISPARRSTSTSATGRPARNGILLRDGAGGGYGWRLILVAHRRSQAARLGKATPQADVTQQVRLVVGQVNVRDRPRETLPGSASAGTPRKVQSGHSIARAQRHGRALRPDSGRSGQAGRWDGCPVPVIPNAAGERDRIRARRRSLARAARDCSCGLRSRSRRVSCPGSPPRTGGRR